MVINFYAGWIGVLCGCIAGAMQGLFFGGEDWLGGYSSWSRRMLRLGHISFFGIGFINILFALSVQALATEDIWLSPLLLFVGAVTMPILCYLSAFKKIFRHLFFIPTLSVIVALVWYIWRIFQ